MLKRREILKASGGLAALAAASNMQWVGTQAWAQEGGKKIRIGLIGAGGRGNGAAKNCIDSHPNVVITVVGDLHQSRAKSAAARFQKLGKKCEITEDNVFYGYEAYKKVCNHPDVDIVLQATPPGIRYLTLREATNAGKHSFVEKPVCVDAFTYQHVAESEKIAATKGLSIVTGTQYRREWSYMDVVKQIHDGGIGDIVSAQGYYISSGVPWGIRKHTPKNTSAADMDYQLTNWLHFSWLSGDSLTEQAIHNVDALDWIMGTNPTKAQHSTGHQGLRTTGDVFDSFAVEYDYGGTNVAMYSGQIRGQKGMVRNRIVGTKGIAIIFPSPGKSRGVLLKHGEKKPFWNNTKTDYEYNNKDRFKNPYIQEHYALVNATITGNRISDIDSINQTSMTSVIGREAVYSGQDIYFDQYTQSGHRLGTDKIEPGKALLPYHKARIPGKYTYKKKIEPTTI